MSSNVDKIKDRISVIDVVQSYIKVEKAGKNFKAKCPFHQDKSPSFSISPDRGLYYCFGCGAKGDMFTFVEEFEGVDFKGALKVLAERAGVELEKEDPKARDEREKLADILEEAALFFEKKLGENKEAEKYIEGRGISKETISRWRIGYAPDAWRDLYDFFGKKNVDTGLLIKAGLVKKKDGGDGFYDVFRDRIVFPIFDPSGRVVGFSGRLLGKNENAPKYLNSPDTMLFDKSRTLYGLNFAKEGIRKKDYSVLVEGQVDIVMSHQAGITNTVASSGTAVTVDHLERLKMLSNNIILAFDSDSAGIGAARRTSEIALSLGMEVKIVSTPEGKDPADMIVESIDGYKDVLKSAQFIIPFFLDHACNGVSDKKKQVQSVRETVLPLAARITSSMDRDRNATLIAERLGVSKQAVLDDLNSVSIEEEKVTEDTIVRKTEVKNSPEREIAGIIVWQQSLPKPLVKVDKTAKELEKVVGEDYFERLMKRAREIQGELIFEMEERYGDSISDKTTDEIISRIKEKQQRQSVTRLQKMIVEAEQSGDEARLNELLREFNETLQDLNKGV